VSPVLELILGVLLAGGGVAFVLRPILAPRPSDDVAAAASDEVVDPEDDLSPRAVALRALKEIEFDRATGKLADADYDALKQRYTAEALEALRDDDRPPTAAPRAPAPRAPLPGRACPAHGSRPESDATFCSECGRRLAAAAGYCPRCGTTLEPEARFCARCGGRVAA
jgi:double zinc ribbon protein